MSKPGDQIPSNGPDGKQPDLDLDKTLPEGAFDKTLPEGWADAPPSDDGATMVGDAPPDGGDGATMVGDDPAPADDGATMVGFDGDAASEDDFGKTLPDGALAQLADDDFAAKTIMMDDVIAAAESPQPEDDFGKTLPDGALAEADDDYANKTMILDSAGAESEPAGVDFDKTLPEGALSAPQDDGATMVADAPGTSDEDGDFGKTLQADAYGKTLATDGTVAPADDFDGKTIVGADSSAGEDVPSATGTMADPKLQRSGAAALNTRATSTGGKTSIDGTQVFGSDQADGIDKDSLNVAMRGISGLQYGPVPRSDFKLVKQLGEGGMGVVYVARQQSLGREVVFKTLKPMAEAQASKLKASGTMNSVIKHRTDMFLSEAVVTADLFHPNIVPIYELARAPDGSLFYTMKWVRGDGWHNRLKHMTLEENLEVLMKVSDAMGFAHSRNIVNRDLKPENVMLGGYGETIVLDWGLALPFGEGKGRLPIATTAGLGSGTPAYMPPELITGPLARIGPACDIYLLGAMLFEVVTGLPPHDFSSRASGGTVSAGAKMAEIRRVVVDNVIRQTGHTGELMDIALKAMATKPEDRYRTVADFQNAIRDYMKHAASRTLADRAKELTVVVTPPVTTETKPDADAQSVGYTNYQNALALYNESLREWTGNHEAREGLTETQLNFAKLALTKGDFDLGLSVLDTNAESHTETRTKLVLAREEREGRVRRMKLLKIAASVLFGAVFLLFAYSSKLQLNLSAALVAEKKAKEETEKALVATIKAQEDQKQAEADRLLAVDEKKKAEEAKILADAAKAKAEEDRLIAETEKAKAKKEADEANVAKNMAIEAQKSADKAKLVAQKDAADAAAAKLLAEKATAQAQKDAEAANVAKTKASYLADLAGANRYVQEGRYPDARKKLDALKKTYPQLCGPEWEQLMNTVTAPQAVSLAKPVESIGLSRDGRRLVTGDSAGHVVVWPIDADGKILDDQPIRQLELGSRLRAVAMSPDGNSIAAAGDDQLIRVWLLTAAANQPPISLKGHDKAVNTLKFSNDGNRLASGSDDNTIRLWSIDGARVLAREKVLYPVSCVDWSRDGKWLVAGTSAPAEVSGVAYSWEVQSVEDQLKLVPIRQFQVLPSSTEKVKQDRGVVAIALTEDGKFAVSNGPAAELHLWQVNPPANGVKKANSLKVNTEAAIKLGVHSNRVERVRSVAFTPDSSRLFVAGDDGSISIWNRDAATSGLPTYKRGQVLYGHGGPVRNCLPLPQSPDLVISGSYDQNVNRWDVKTYLKTREWIEAPKESTPPAAFRQTDSEVSLLEIPASSEIPTCGAEHDSDSAEAVRSEFLLVSFPQTEKEASQKPGEKADVATPNDKPRKSVRIAAGIAENKDRVGHTDSVLSAVFSRDGTRVISSSRDQTARSWNSETGLPVNTVTGQASVFDDNLFKEGHEYDLFAMRFFPDSQRLLTSGFDGEMRIWDSRIDAQNSFGRELAMLPGTSMYGVVDISRDGEWILTAGRGNSAQLWNTKNVLTSRLPKPERVLDNVHRFRVTTVAISPDNSRLVTGDREGRLVLWNAQTGKVVGQPRNSHSGEVVKSEFLGDGSRLLTAGVDRRVVLWKVIKTDTEFLLEKIRQFDHEGMVVNLAVSPLNDRFISVARLGDKKVKTAGTQTSNTKVSLWDIETGKERVIELLPLNANRVAKNTDRPPFPSWAANGTLAVITTAEGIIHFLDSNTVEITQSLQVEDNPEGAARRAEPYAAILRPDEPRPLHLMTQTHNASFLWRLKDGENVVSFRPQGPVFSAGYSSDGRFIVTGGRSVRIFDADETKITYGRLLHKVEYAHDGVATSVEFSPAEKSFRFLTTSYDETAKIWEWSPDRKIARLVHTLRGHTGPVRFGTWSADGARVLTVGHDARPHVWSFPAGAEPKAIVLEFPKDQADKNDEKNRDFDQLCGAFSWDGQFVAIGGRDVDTGESIGWIWNLAPASGETPTLYATVRGHGLGGINSVAFLPDDDRLLTGGTDGTARLWDWQKSSVAANEGKVVEADFLISLVRRTVDNQATTHRGAVTSVRVTRNGNIVTASSDGTVLIWPK